MKSLLRLTPLFLSMCDNALLPTELKTRLITIIKERSRTLE